jgi:CRISPR-associated exonuclease Cas4
MVEDALGYSIKGRKVYPNHMIQALAYCALVEDQMKVPVPYALVIYAGERLRKVEFTNERRQWLLRTIQEVELARERLAADRNHDHRGRCVGCGVRSNCNQALL